MNNYRFGEYLTKLRRNKGYSQFQLGKLLGVTDRAVSKWENGAAIPRMKVCRKMAAILDVDVYSLLDLAMGEKKTVEGGEPEEIHSLEEKMNEIREEIESYRQTIYDAEGALDAAEKELDELLDIWARENHMFDDDDFFPSDEEIAEFQREYPPIPNPIADEE